MTLGVYVYFPLACVSRNMSESRNTYSANQHALKDAKIVDRFGGDYHVVEQPLGLGLHHRARPLGGP